MKKRLFALLLAVLLVAGALPMAAVADESFPTNGDCSLNQDGSLTWEVENGTLMISGSDEMKSYGGTIIGGAVVPWYYESAVKWAVKNGITSGTGSGFSPAAKLSPSSTVGSKKRYGKAMAFPWPFLLRFRLKSCMIVASTTTHFAGGIPHEKQQ